MKRNGAQIVMESLLKEGVRDIFGYPGGAVLPLYDAFKEYPQLNHILVRHEQGAAFAAQGFARVMGKAGVCIATSGPGATNLVTAIADALLDSIPLVCITGQVPSGLIGSDAFQETDVVGVTMPITKHNYLVETAADLPRIMKEAFYIAESGRPGPVLIDIPKDVFLEEADFVYPDEVQVSGYDVKSYYDEDDIEAAVSLINESKRPIIIAGHGVQLAGAEAELNAFIEKTGIPTACTIHSMGSLAHNHPLNLDMLGMHGHAETNFAVHEADLIIGIGMRFDDRITGNLASFASDAKVIHVEIDPAEIDKNVKADVGIIGDCKEVVQVLNDKCESRSHDDWLASILEKRDVAQNELKKAYPRERDGDSRPFTRDAVEAIRNICGDDAVIVTDVGQHQMFTCQAFNFNKPNKNLTSGGLGTMGFSLPTAMGAKVALPNVDVWSISGDGGFQMNMQELMTIVEENIPVKVLIIQNFYLGMVRQWQEIFFKRNYASSVMSSPKYKYIAKAYDLPYFSAERLDEVGVAIRKMHECSGPCLGEIFVKPDENVLPMVPAGASLGETIVNLD